jgi:hypothetical protein
LVGREIPKHKIKKIKNSSLILAEKKNGSV